MNHNKLRLLAREATPGPWITAPSLNQHSGLFFGTEGNPENPSEPDLLLGSAAYSRDADFIAAANPAAVLALLDEIDALRKGQGHYEGKQS